MKIATWKLTSRAAVLYMASSARLNRDASGKYLNLSSGEAPASFYVSDLGAYRDRTKQA